MRKGLTALCVCALAGVAGAASFHLETFGSSPLGWASSADPPMSVNYDNTQGNVGLGSMRGDFTPSFFPAASSFQITQSQFINAYPSGSTALRFDFMAETQSPVTLMLQFDDGINQFTYVLVNQIAPPGQWATVVAPLMSVSGWTGGTQAQFDAALANVQQLNIYISRPSTLVTERYYIDNLELTGDLIFIPEPASGVLLLGSSFLLLARRRLAGQSDAQSRWRYLRLRLAQRRSI